MSFKRIASALGAVLAGGLLCSTIAMSAVAAETVPDSPKADPKMSCDAQGSGFAKLMDLANRLQNAFDALNQNLYKNSVWINEGMAYSSTLPNAVFSPDSMGTQVKSDGSFTAEPQNIFVYLNHEPMHASHWSSSLHLDSVLAHCVEKAMTTPLGNVINVDPKESFIKLHYMMDPRVAPKGGKITLKMTSRFFAINSITVGTKVTKSTGSSADTITFDYPAGSKGFDLKASVLDAPNMSNPADMVTVNFVNDDFYITEDGAKSTIPNNAIKLDGHIEGKISSDYARDPAVFGDNAMYNAVDPTEITYIPVKVPAMPTEVTGKCEQARYAKPADPESGLYTYSYNDKGELLATAMGDGANQLFFTGAEQSVINFGKPKVDMSGCVMPKPDMPKKPDMSKPMMPIKHVHKSMPQAMPQHKMMTLAQTGADVMVMAVVVVAFLAMAVVMLVLRNKKTMLNK